MTTKKINTKKTRASTLVVLPCRANSEEAAIIRKAAELTTRGNVTMFIIQAAVSVAKEAFVAHGVGLEEVLAQSAVGGKKIA